MVGAEEDTVICLANSVREVVEIRNFAVRQENVLQVKYGEKAFPGEFTNEEELKRNNLKR